jgi:hypothetical protein
MSVRSVLALTMATLAAVAGHAVFLFLVIRGAPCLNTLYPGSFAAWSCDLARFTFYLAVALGTVSVWRGTSGRPRPRYWWAIMLAAGMWTYWFILDPSLLAARIGGTPVGKWWMQRTYGRPFVGDLYWGWGFAKYHAWLAAVQGLLTAIALLVVSHNWRTQGSSSNGRTGAAER